MSSDLPDEVTTRATMNRLKKEAEERGLPDEIKGDPFLHSIIKDFKRDPRAGIEKEFVNEKFTKFEYMLLTLLLEVKEALNKKRYK